jgi:hypothetical protein
VRSAPILIASRDGHNVRRRNDSIDEVRFRSQYLGARAPKVCDAGQEKDKPKTTEDNRKSYALVVITRLAHRAHVS